MNENSQSSFDKPSAEAKALSLYLMAHKKTSALHKEKAKRINKRWDMVLAQELERESYDQEVNAMLEEFGGYKEVITQTVHHYVKVKGAWNSQGQDKYAKDAQKIAESIAKNN